MFCLDRPASVLDCTLPAQWTNKKDKNNALIGQQVLDCRLTRRPAKQSCFFLWCLFCFLFCPFCFVFFVFFVWFVWFCLFCLVWFCPFLFGFGFLSPSPFCFLKHLPSCQEHSPAAGAARVGWECPSKSPSTELEQPLPSEVWHPQESTLVASRLLGDGSR